MRGIRELLDVDSWPLRSHLLFSGLPSGSLPTAVGRTSSLIGVAVTTPRGTRARARFGDGTVSTPCSAAPRAPHGDEAHFGVKTYIDEQLTPLGVVTACSQVLNPFLAHVAYDGVPSKEPCGFCVKVHPPTAELASTAPPGERNTPQTMKCTTCDRFLSEPMQRFRPTQSDRLRVDAERRKALPQPAPEPATAPISSATGAGNAVASRPVSTPLSPTDLDRVGVGERLRSAAGWAPAAIVFAAAPPVVWIGVGIAVGFAYLGNPLFETWWQGPLGFVAHVVATVVLSGMAAVAAAAAVRGPGR